MRQVIFLQDLHIDHLITGKIPYTELKRLDIQYSGDLNTKHLNAGTIWILIKLKSGIQIFQY